MHCQEQEVITHILTPREESGGEKYKINGRNSKVES